MSEENPLCATAIRRVAATTESWPILAQPSLRVALAVSESYTHDEFERIKRGCIPEQMENKWFIYFEEPWLFFHRSLDGRLDLWSPLYSVGHAGVDRGSLGES